MSPIVICPLIGMLVHNRRRLLAKIVREKTEVTTAEEVIDLENQRPHLDVASTRKDSAIFTDLHGNQHLPPPLAYQPFAQRV